MGKALTPEGKFGVRIVVAGDQGTGKSSLIETIATNDAPRTNLPRLLPPTRLPENIFPDNVPITIIDTSSNPEDRGKLEQELKQADVIVLTYACDKPETFNRLTTFWIPKLRQLESKIPVIIACCKLELKHDNDYDHVRILQQFPEIENFIDCSAYENIQIPEVFYYAQRAVIHSTNPLFDQKSQTLRPKLVRALKRIFILCDHDRDGVLSDVEFHDFHVKCLDSETPLGTSEIIDVKEMVKNKLPEGVDEEKNGLTLIGFLFLHALFIENGRVDATWNALRKFGYNNDIKLSDDLIPRSSFKRNPDQSVELTEEAIEFLKGVYELFDTDLDNNLRYIEVEDVFSTAPENPWSDVLYKDAAEETAIGGLSLEAFLSKWNLMTLLNPVLTVENLIYIGYPNNPLSATRVTRRRSVDRKKKQSGKNVFQCFVFGPRRSGKSALINSFLGKPYSDSYFPTADKKYAVNFVEHLGGIKKTLIFREIPEDGVSKVLFGKDSLAACDIAIFVYDSSDESSWKTTAELLEDVAGHGEDTGYEMPCLIVAAKSDLDQFPMLIQDSTRVSRYMGIEEPIEISSKLGDFNDIFRRIVNAAQNPHLSIPETEDGRSRKENRLRKHSLRVVSVGAAAVAIVGLVTYCAWKSAKWIGCF
ncbi:Small GTPase superfamily [Corchorus olitorius]|uniref:Mitochondrial Rho GTPase n=1 Tax=Corchorus olitorius TaxID=93759 RepID=A0A1R3JQ01_9ROSI|nr:Small GTPase superfamily [Corchorus olitorius]